MSSVANSSRLKSDYQRRSRDSACFLSNNLSEFVREFDFSIKNAKNEGLWCIWRGLTVSYFLERYVAFSAVQSVSLCLRRPTKPGIYVKVIDVLC